MAPIDSPTADSRTRKTRATHHHYPQARELLRCPDERRALARTLAGFYVTVWSILRCSRVFFYGVRTAAWGYSAKAETERANFLSKQAKKAGG